MEGVKQITRWQCTHCGRVYEAKMQAELCFVRCEQIKAFDKKYLPVPIQYAITEIAGLLTSAATTACLITVHGVPDHNDLREEVRLRSAFRRSEN